MPAFRSFVTFGRAAVFVAVFTVVAAVLAFKPQLLNVFRSGPPAAKGEDQHHDGDHDHHEGDGHDHAAHDHADHDDVHSEEGSAEHDHDETT